MNAAIDIRNLSHAYGNQKVLGDLSFQIEKGEFFIIIGPNGSGKTTSLKLMAGLEKAVSGSIRIHGKLIGEYGRKSLARIMALVPQMQETDFPFSVEEIVLMGRSPHMGLLGFESEKDRQAVKRATAFTAVDHLLDRKLSQISGGERQRVFLARAICQEPDIILLDEPTAALDLAHQVRIMDLMESLKKDRSVTVIMVSHDINLAAHYAGRMLLLKDGRALAMGAPKDIVKAEAIKAAYGCDVVVDESPLGQIPRIIPIPGKYSNNPK